MTTFPITPAEAPKRAAILAQDVAFQRYAARRNGFHKGEFSPSEATEHLRQVCNIQSRRELASDPAAFERFQNLFTDFDLWAGRIQAPNR
jgi:hypothetical protein